jgi:hypothetical protein
MKERTDSLCHAEVSAQLMMSSSPGTPMVWHACHPMVSDYQDSAAHEICSMGGCQMFTAMHCVQLLGHQTAVCNGPTRVVFVVLTL